MFKRLLWKEWQENLWKLGFCLVTSFAFTALLFRMRLVPDSQNAVLIGLFQLFIVPVIYALDIFSGEISNRTIHLLFKIPTERWKIFLSKYLVATVEIGFVFLFTGVLMEILAHGRETEVGYLLQISLLCGLSAQGLFVWFCVFGCQGRSEAGSLVALVAVMIGWGILFFWAEICGHDEVNYWVPYTFAYKGVDTGSRYHELGQVFGAQTIAWILALVIAGYRFVKVRRYL